MCMDWFKDLFIDEIKPVVDKWNSAGGSGGSGGGSGGSVNIPTKLSDLENDLFYIKKEPVVTLTKADFTLWESPYGDVCCIYTGTPAMSWIKRAADVLYDLDATLNFDGEIVRVVEQDIVSNFFIERTEDGGDSLYCICGDNLFTIISGSDFKDEDNFIAKDEFTINLLAPFEMLESIQLTIYRDVSKRVPIEYCDTSEIEAEIDALAMEVDTL